MQQDQIFTHHSPMRLKADRVTYKTGRGPAKKFD